MVIEINKVRDHHMEKERKEGAMTRENGFGVRRRREKEGEGGIRREKEVEGRRRREKEVEARLA